MASEPEKGVPAHVEPTLEDNIEKPQGVVRKNLRMTIYIGCAIVLLVVMLVTNATKKDKTPKDKRNGPPAPIVEDNTANNVAALHAQFTRDGKQQQAQQAQQDTELAATGSSAQQAAAAGLGPNGQPLVGGSYGAPAQSANNQPPQLTATEQAAQQIAQEERKREYAARFASNLVYAASAQQQNRQQGQGQGSDVGSGQEPPTNFTRPGEPTGPQPQEPDEPNAGAGAAARPASYKRSPEVNVDSAVGQPYVIYEGTTLDTVLMNRLDGDAPGPVKVMVSNPVYSHDLQHVLIPAGTVVLGEARTLGGSGFGQKRRVTVVFHRMIMPDGYSVDLDQFHGLDQIGEQGLKDKVNNHYLQIFGTSIALGVISGAAQITQGGGGYNQSGSQAFANGAAAGISQQATTVLDRFIQIPPTITIREGHRVKVYFTQDMLLPAYTHHTIPQSF